MVYIEPLPRQGRLNSEFFSKLKECGADKFDSPTGLPRWGFRRGDLVYDATKFRYISDNRYLLNRQEWPN